MSRSKPEGKTTAIVTLSGGLDSAVALFWAFGKGWHVEGLSFDYFQRSKMEIASAKKLANYLHCAHRRIKLGFLKELEDLKLGSERRNSRLAEAPSAYIPSRNVIFYGIATSIAEALDARYVVSGHNKKDVESFPDSSTEFFREFNKTTSIGSISGRSTGRVILPLAKLSKARVIRLGQRLGVPFELTWSCYRSDVVPCGKCPACKLRASGFRWAGIHDPLLSQK